MKQIKLNTLVFIFLSSLITLSFLVLFFTTTINISNLQEYALDREDKHIRKIINDVFVSDIEKQSTYLNESFERVTVFAKLISKEVNNIINKKSYKSNNEVELEFDKKNKIYHYIDKDTLIQKNDTFWGFGSVWIGNSKEKVNNIPSKTQINLNNIFTIQQSLELICLNPNNIVGIYVVFKDHAIGYSKNIKKLINTIKGSEFSNNKKLLDDESKDKISHWSTSFTSEIGNDHLMNYYYYPQPKNKPNNFRVVIKLSFNQLQKKNK